MKFQQLLTFLVITAGMGWAMAEALGDTAVGIAVGAAVAAAITGVTARRSCPPRAPE